jgi:hypothetical protein
MVSVSIQTSTAMAALSARPVTTVASIGVLLSGTLVRRRVARARARRRTGRRFTGVVALAALGLLAACGGGGGYGGGSTGGTGETPPGVYTVGLVPTSGSVSHSVSLTLTVQ